MLTHARRMKALYNNLPMPAIFMQKFSGFIIRAIEEVDIFVGI